MNTFIIDIPTAVGIMATFVVIGLIGPIARIVVEIKKGNWPWF